MVKFHRNALMNDTEMNDTDRAQVFPMFRPQGLWISKALGERSLKIAASAVQSRFFVWGRFVLFAALIVSVSVVVESSAQEYRQDTVNETVGGEQSSIFQSLQTGAGNPDQVQTFLKDYYLARWTVHDNARYVHTYRAELVGDAATMSASGRATFLGASIEQLSALIAAEDVAPAVRFNAVLAIGELNESGQAGGTETPYAPAIPALVGFCAADKKLPDYIVLGALIGLVRHAALGISDDAARQSVVQVFLDTLEPSYDRKHNFSQEITAWLQQKAVMGLAAFRSPSGGGEGTRILDTFRRIIEEPSGDYQLQNLSARGISEMNFENLGDYDVAGLAHSMLNLILSLSKKEVNFIEKESIRGQYGSKQKVGGAGTMGIGAAQPAGGATLAETVNLELVLGQVKYDLESVRMAISGSEGGAGVQSLVKEDDAESKALLNTILSEINKTVLFLDFGPDSLAEDFDPKKIKTPGGRRNQKVYSVDTPMVKEFISDQVIHYRELSGEDTMDE